MTKAKNELRVMVTGGGTAGHINPGLALIAEVRRQSPGAEFLWVGTRDRLEARLVPAADVAIEYIQVAFLKGRGLLGKLAAIVRIPRAFWQSNSLLRRFRPDVVVGVGGFASGPVTLIAALRRTPTAILEQNARPGLTNRILGKFVRRVFISFEESVNWFAEKKTRLLGNPVRPGLLEPTAAPEAREDECQVRILVIGGSQGATSLNRDLPKVLRELVARGVTLAVQHSAGRGRGEEVTNAYGDMPSVQVHEYIDDMASAYSWADFVICRSGASTVAELAVIGKAAMYVPFPLASDNHQEKNALAVVDKDGGVLVSDSQLASDPPYDTLQELLADRDRIEAMGRAAKTLGKPEAAQEIARAVIDLVK